MTARAWVVWGHWDYNEVVEVYGVRWTAVDALTLGQQALAADKELISVRLERWAVGGDRVDHLSVIKRPSDGASCSTCSDPAVVIAWSSDGYQVEGYRCRKHLDPVPFVIGVEAVCRQAGRVENLGGGVSLPYPVCRDLCGPCRGRP